MTRLLLISLTLLVLSGCGSTAYTWSKPGVSRQQAQQEGFECKQISRQPYYVPVGGVIVGGSEPDVRIWIECLEARGYTVTKESEDSAPSSSLGSLCAPSNAMIGTRLRRSQDGKMVKVTALYADSPRCSDPATPTPVDVEEVGEGESSVSASKGCGPSTVTIGTRLKYPNGKMVKVKTLYGNSPRCSDPATPILVDVEEVGE